MFMTNEERELRKKFRLKLEEIADRNKLFDNYGNEIKAIHITDVMRLLLAEDTEILELQNKIQELDKIRVEFIANNIVATPLDINSITIVSYFDTLDTQSKEDINNKINDKLLELRKDRGISYSCNNENKTQQNMQ